MDIDFNCECGKRLKTQEDHAGREARCPACGRTVRIPNLPTLEIVSGTPEPSPAVEKPLTAPELQPIQSPYVIPYDENGQRVLLQLRRIHLTIAQAKTRLNPLWIPLIFGFTFGILGLFIVACIAVAIYGDQKMSNSPVPGLFMLMAFFGTFLFATWYDRRKRRAKAYSFLRTAEEELETSVKEIQAKFPQWVSSIGGPGVLMDTRRFTDEFNLMRHRESSAYAVQKHALCVSPRVSSTNVPTVVDAIRDFKYRNPATIFPLSLVTMGIYSLVWIYKIHSELARRFPDNKTITSPGLALGLCFVPIFNIIWFIILLYGVVQRANEVLKEQGLPPAASNDGVLAMLVVGQIANIASLAFMPLALISVVLLWIVTAKVQAALNKAWLAEGLIGEMDK